MNVGAKPTDRWTAIDVAQLGVSFAGIEMDGGYLKEAVTRTRAALA